MSVKVGYDLIKVSTYLEEGVVDTITQTHVHRREQDSRIQGVDLPGLDKRIEQQATDFHVPLLSLGG